MKVLQNEFVTDRSKAIKRFKSILDVGRKLMRSPIYKAVTFIMLWKLISKNWVKMGNERYNHGALVDDVVNLCVEYAQEYIDENRDIEKYTKFKESLTRYSKYIRFVTFFQSIDDER